MSKAIPEKTKGIIEELGLSHIPKAEQAELTATAARLLQDRIILAILEVLTEEEVKELDEMALDDHDDDKVGKWLVEKIPGLDAIAYSEYIQVREELLEDKADIEEAVRDYQRQIDEHAKKKEK